MPRRSPFSVGPPVPSRGRAWLTPLVVLVGVLGLGFGPLAPVAHAQDPGGSDAGTPRTRYDDALERMTQDRARVDALYQVHRDLDAEAVRLGGDQRTVTQRLEQARAQAQRRIVEAYMTGAVPAVEDSIVHQDSTTDVAYKSFFVQDRAEQMKSAIAAQRQAGLALDSQSSELAARRADNTGELEQANADLDRSIERFRAADVELRRAEHDAAEKIRADAAEKARADDAAATAAAAARAATTTTRPPAVVPPAPAPAPAPGSGGGTGNAQGPGWAKLRQCEATGNYAAVSPGGVYRGAYQFDVQTWRSLGGSGDPAAAAPAEQDLRAQLLFNKRGAQPWPICGRFLL